MKPILVSFDGHNINDATNYIGTIPIETPLQPIQARTNFIRRAGATPVYSGKELPEAYLTITIICMGTVREQLETINQWFNVYDETPKQLIIKDTEDSDKQYSIYATPRSVSPLIGRNAVRISLARKDPVWKSVTQNSVSWSITASAQTQAVVNNGNIETYPYIEFTPTSYPTGGWGYSNKVKFYPTSAFPYPSRPIEIFGGLNTAALVTGSKLLATGDDLRVLVNGVEVPRWFGDAGTSVINSTATKCWIVLDVPAKQEATLKTAIANSGTPAIIDIAYNVLNKAAVTAMPATGRVIIDNEEFTYTAKTITATALSLTVGVRTARNTSIASHSAAAVVRFVPFDITYIYGNSAATAPEIDDTKKPVIDLANSTNASFVYTSFYDAGEIKGQRAGAWKPFVVSTTGKLLTQSGVYFGTNRGADTDPAEVMGMQASVFQSAGLYKAETATIEWRGDFPDGVSNVDSNGHKYRAGTKWATTARLFSSILGTSWLAEWALTEATPASAATWTAWTHNTEAIAGAARYLKYQLIGTTLATAGDYQAFEVTAVTVALVNYPSVAIRTEESSYYLEARITNTTTGDYINFQYPLVTNETLVIDTDPNQPYAKKNGQLVNVIKPDTNRSNWLPLAPGSNTLTFTAASNNNITCVVKHYDRMNYL